MAAASDEYMPSDEDVDVAVFWDDNGGVQPYRFEPQCSDSDGDNFEEEEPQDDDNPFQNDIKMNPENPHKNTKYQNLVTINSGTILQPSSMSVL